MKKIQTNSVLLIVLLTTSLFAISLSGSGHTGHTHVSDPSADALTDEASRIEAHTPTDKAIAKWTKQVEKNPQDSNGWVNLGNALMQKARETSNAVYYNHAESAFGKALGLDSNSPLAMVGMAWVCGGRHEFEQSIEWANRAIAVDAKNQDAYGLLGDAAVEIGDYEEAFEYYQQMLDIRPDLASYSRGAHLLYLTGDTRKATWLMQKAIEAGGPYTENTAWCQAQMALMLWNTGALLPAEQLLQKALSQAPDNPYVLAVMGKIKASRKDYDAAIDYYTRAIAGAPQHNTLVALGDLYMVTNEKQKAEQQYARIEAIHESNRANGMRGDILMARFYADHDRNLPEALQEAEMVYKKHKNVFVADTLAWCYYKNGRDTEAKKAIQKALKLRTPDANILFHAGMIYAKLGNRPIAQKYLYQALSLNPHFHPIYAGVATDTLKQLSSVTHIEPNLSLGEE